MQEHTMNGSSVLHPYVAKIMAMGVRNGSEYIGCELPGGTDCELILSGTSLDGWVTSRVMMDAGGLATIESWAEFGVRDDGTHYIELLFSANEFDWLPVHAYHRRIQPMRAYDEWKELHRVTHDGCPDMPLYYGEL